MTALPETTSPLRTVVRTGRIDSSPPPTAQVEGVRMAVSHTLFTLSLLVVWALLYLLLLSGFEQAHAQRGLYDRLRTQLAEGTAPTGAPVEAGDPLALIDIPRAGVDNLVVVEGTRSEQLKDGPGHFPGTVMPGQEGVSVVMGKGLSFGGPFGGLTSLGKGDPVRVVTAQGTFRYVVSGVRRAGDLTPAPPAPGASRLTLVTAAGDGPFAALRPSDTFYVDATLDSGAVARGPVSYRDPQGVPMATHADTGLLAQLAIALQLLGAALAAVVWAWTRWSRTAAWITGVPVVVAALWICSSLATRLLPGLV